MTKINKLEIQNFLQKSIDKGERIIDTLVEIQRRYQLDVQEVIKLLNKEQKEKLKQQELKLRNIKE